jgi:hypothetical protein
MRVHCVVVCEQGASRVCLPCKTSPHWPSLWRQPHFLKLLEMAVDFQENNLFPLPYQLTVHTLTLKLKLKMMAGQQANFKKTNRLVNRTLRVLRT